MSSKQGEGGAEGDSATASAEGDSKTAEQSDTDRRESRRNFLKGTLAAAVVLVAAGVAAITKSLFPSTQSTGSSSTSLSFPRVKVANLADLQPNKPITFNYPLDNEPNVLIKLGQKATGGVGPDGDVVAFSQICQHLGCIYGYLEAGASPSCDSSYKAPGPVGYCCCHASIFDFVDAAKVIAGPSLRPQPQVMLELDSSSGDIFATGMKPPTIFGHNTGSNDVSADLQGGTLVS